MIRRSTDQTGSAHIIIVLLVAVAVVGSLAFFSYNRLSDNTDAVDSTAKTLESKSDITQAKNDIDKLSADEDLDPSQLDGDLQQL